MTTAIAVSLEGEDLTIEVATHADPNEAFRRLLLSVDATWIHWIAVARCRWTRIYPIGVDSLPFDDRPVRIGR